MCVYALPFYSTEKYRLGNLFPESLLSGKNFLIKILLFQANFESWRLKKSPACYVDGILIENCNLKSLSGMTQRQKIFDS